MLMIARRPVALSWQKATCSCSSAERCGCADSGSEAEDEAGGEVGLAGGDETATVVTPVSGGDRVGARLLRTITLCRGKDPNWLVSRTNLCEQE
jgi:hypothetical protein